ncbi:MAG: flagellin [Syntrophomonas sp.]
MRVDEASTNNYYNELSAAAAASSPSSSETAKRQASEDAYKLDIASGLRAQNIDLNQAYKDIQDSTSLLQVAEQGMSVTESILARIQELTEKATAEGLSDSDLDSIQEQIDELVSEVDRVGLATQDKIKEILENSALASGKSLNLTDVPQSLLDEIKNSNLVNDLPFDVNCGDDDLKITLQIGANAGETMTIKIKAMNSKKLGLDEIDVTTRDNAVKSLKQIDKAIGSVSSQRARLGATARCLEHTINYLTTMHDNLADAESRIRSVDMAKEMSEFVKNSIQNKIAGAMMVHANQRPKMILKLLEAI